MPSTKSNYFSFHQKHIKLITIEKNKIQMRWQHLYDTHTSRHEDSNRQKPAYPPLIIDLSSSCLLKGASGYLLFFGLKAALPSLSLKSWSSEGKKKKSKILGIATNI